MANSEHLERLRAGVKGWNEWRAAQGNRVVPDLSGVCLREINLADANLSRCNLDGVAISTDTSTWRVDLSASTITGASLSGNFEESRFNNSYLSQTVFGEGTGLVATDFTMADLTGAKMAHVDAERARFIETDMIGTDLRHARLEEASFVHAKMSRADLSDADLRHARFLLTDLSHANLNDALVFGVSVWGVQLDGARQQGLAITSIFDGYSNITVDDLELAQFIYMLLNNRSMRRIIDTITSKVVLILGSFSGERKPILDALRDAIRNANYTPILFDFEKPDTRDITETVSTLAHMARFVIADITEARSVRQELERIVPGLPSVPVQPLLLAGEAEFAMFEHFRRYPWVLEPVRYESRDALIGSLRTTLIPTLEAAVKAIRS